MHKYNGINLKPLPVSMVPKFVQSPALPLPVAEHKLAGVVPPTALPAATPTSLAANPIVVVAPAAVSTKTQEDVQGIMKLLGISDASKVPSIPEIMDLLGASTQEEAIDTVKEIAATEEGIDMIKSFIESRQAPDEDAAADIEIVEAPAPTTTEAPTTTTTTTTTPAPAPVIVEQPISSHHHFWSPKNLLASATYKAASHLDRTHTNAALLGNILADTQVAPTQSTFRNTLQNLKNFFSFHDNTAVPLQPAKKLRPRPHSQSPTSQVVYINEPIPSSPISLPSLPKLSPLPDLPPGIVGTIPSMPKIPKIQIPSHFSVPKSVVQGPYMNVNYPVASLAPLPVYRQHPLYSYRGQPITSAQGAVKTSFEVPLYGPPATGTFKSQIPFSQSTKDAFKGAPKIISSFPVPSLPYESDAEVEEEEEEPLSESANSPIEVVALPDSVVGEQEATPGEQQQQQVEVVALVEDSRRAEIAKADDDDGSDAVEGDVQVSIAGPQRLSGYEAYATGKVHRATNVDVVQSILTNGGHFGDQRLLSNDAEEELEAQEEEEEREDARDLPAEDQGGEKR